MASKYWLKMYHEAINDPKLASLPDNLWRRFWECCLLAGAEDKGGILPPLFEIAFTVRISEDGLRAELGQLAMRGFVELKEYNGEERWFVSNFAKRQAASNDAKRMREYRKRKRKEAKEKEKEILDIDTDIDTYRRVTRVTKRNGQINTQTHPVYDIPNNLKTEQFEEAFIRWYSHMIDKGNPMTQASGDALLERLSKIGPDRAVVAINHSMANNWKSVHEPKQQGQNGRSSSRMIPDESTERTGGLY